MRHLILTLGLALPLSSCGGGSDPAAQTTAGHSALGSGDHAAALADFEGALSAIGSDTAHPQYMRATMGAIEANATLDPDRAVADFKALAAKTEVPDRDYSKVGGWLAAAKNYGQAIDVLDAGMKKFEGSETLVKLTEKIKTEAEKAGDSDALAKMRGLGYL